jgi:D-alanyl-D-alanine carboxypeptidase
MLSGSIGKTYVAAVMLRLVEIGKASLDDNISRWLGKESWFTHLPNGKEITLRMLLNHSSGLRNHVDDEQFVVRAKNAPDAFWSHEDLVKYDLDKPPLFPPGKGFAYADTNYILVGLIIEKITGRSYYSELHSQILGPLKLKDTAPSNQRVISGMVSAYTDPKNPFGLPEKVCIDGKDALNPQIEWTGGGLVSTSPDLARWAWLLLGGHVLKGPSLKEMLSGIPARSEGGRYGLGMGIRETELGPAYGHDGEFPGFESVMAYFPRYNIAVAVQFNTDDENRFKLRPRDFAIQLAKLIVNRLQGSSSMN